MIIASVSVGMVCGLITGTSLLFAGHSLWAALVGYTLVGMIAVPLFAVFALVLFGLCAKMRRATDTEYQVDPLRHTRIISLAVSTKR